jgi:hypothetical protein
MNAVALSNAPRASRRAARALAWGVVVGAMFAGPAPVSAQEVIDSEEPPPTSVEDSVSPIQRFMRLAPQRPGVFPWLKDQLKDTPPVFRDTKLDLNLRSFYFDRNKPGNVENEAWAIGGAASYRSGWIADLVSGGATFYWSQDAYGPEDKDGTLLLKPGQEDYWVVGELYGKVKLAPDNFLNLGRYGGYNTPFLNRNDTRMTPNTFQGYTLTGAYKVEDSDLSLKYGGGYIDKIKLRNADHFVYMSTAAGANVDRGVALGGGVVQYGPFYLGAIDYYSPDIINIGYTEARATTKATEDLGLLLALQYSDQRSVGDDKLSGSYFSTRQFGVKGEASYLGAILTLSYTITADDADMQTPWGGYPGYTSVQVQDFDFANQQAFLVKASYDLSKLRLDGVSAYALFVHGWSQEDPSTGDSVPNQDEYDANLQWTPKGIAMIDGLSLRLRYALVHNWEGPGNDIHDIRVIVNYDFSVM